MKSSCNVLIIGVIVFFSKLASFGQLAIPSDGSDGVFAPVGTNVVIDLSQAVAKSWTNNNATNAGKGIYDSNQWAVVYKYER